MSLPGGSTWGTADFGAISRDFDRKISRPRKSFENFGQNFAENRTESHVPQHADARHSDWGPLRLVRRLQHAEKSGFRRDLEPKMLRPRKIFENFGPKFAENRTESHVPRGAVAS